MTIAQTIGNLTGMNVNMAAIINTIILAVEIIVVALIVIFAIYWYSKKQKYNMNGEIWWVNTNTDIPRIEKNIKGGYFIENGKRIFHLEGERFRNAVINLNPKHIIRNGKQWNFWLRAEGDRYFYSFIPKKWVNKKGETDFVLEVEDSSIVNQAIDIDAQILRKGKQISTLEKYAPYFLVSAMIFGAVIMYYFTSKWAASIVNEVHVLNSACMAAKSAPHTNWGLIPLLTIPKKWIKRK